MTDIDEKGDLWLHDGRCDQWNNILLYLTTVRFVASQILTDNQILLRM
jgi:hypothetical protein